MPLEGQTLATVNYIAERFIVQKVQPVAADVVTNWVDSVNGSDSGAGRGDITTPFKTMQAALKQVACLTRQEQFVLQLVPSATPYELPDGYVFPAVVSPDNVSNDPGAAFGFQASASVTVRSAPTLLLSLAPADIAAQNIDTQSGLVTVVTVAAMPIGAYSGLWLRESSTNTLWRIQGNDANNLTVCHAGALVGTLEIYAAGATLAPANPGSQNPTVQVRNSTGVAVFQGVDIVSSAGGSMGISGDSQVELDACTLQGALFLGLGQNSIMPADGYVEALACNFNNLLLISGVFLAQGCYFPSGALFDCTNRMSVAVFQSIFEKMNSPLWSANGHSPSLVQLANVEIRDTTGNAIELHGRPLVDLSSVKITGATGQDIVLLGSAEGDTVRTYADALNPDLCTIFDKVVLVDSSGGPITEKLPPLRACQGLRLTFKKISADLNNIDVDADLGETIDGALTFPLTVQYDFVTIVAGPLEWYVLAK